VGLQNVAIPTKLFVKRLPLAAKLTLSLLPKAILHFYRHFQDIVIDRELATF
jgi:hypothetical protein